MVLPLLLASAPLAAQEICDNGIDDDGNGLIDLNDPACSCSALLNPGNVPSFFPNHAFEQLTTCCPVAFSAMYDAFWCLEAWEQATAGTSDFMHPCGLYPPVFPPPPDQGGYVGFIPSPQYHEYVGRCLPPGILQAGVEYTLSLWILGTSLGLEHPGSIVRSLGVYYNDPLPFTIFGSPTCTTNNPTVGCMGEVGWVPLTSIDHHATGAWQQVSMTFTPPFDVRGISIGGGCDMPGSFAPVYNEDSVRIHPYFLVDELMLNVASAFVTLPVTAAGGVCSEDLFLTAFPPAQGTGYQWYHEGVAIMGATGLTLEPLAYGMGTGTYTFTMDYQGQCLQGWTTVPGPGTEPVIDVGSNEGCVPLTVTFSEVRHPGAEVDWWFGDGGTASGITVEHTYVTPGIYDVRVQVNTMEGCVLDSTFLAAVIAHPLPQVSFHASPQPVYVGNTTVTLEDATSGVVAQRHWDLDTIPPYVHDASNIEVVLPDVPGKYPVMLTIVDDHGCTGTAASELIVLDDSLPEMPNVFSPNGDGRNDRFVPLNDWYGTGQLDILNRWGQVVHSTTRPGEGWDGQVNGSPAPDGTYFYMLKVYEPQEAMGQGTFQLLR